MQIRSTAWTLAQLLSLAASDAFPMEAVAPWRMKHPLTDIGIEKFLADWKSRQ